MGLLAIASLVGLTLFAGSALAAQPPVGLGTADSFAVLAGSAVTNTGPSTINGNLGVNPKTAISGFPPGTVNGTIHSADAIAAQAQSDLTIAYDDAAGRTPALAVSGDLGGLTVTAGVYKSSSSLGLTGPLTLDAQGDPDAVFIFQVASSLTTASGSEVRLINGAQPCNVYWQIGSSATLGTASVFAGNLLALTSISMNNAVTLNGRALARNGAVTLINDTIGLARCAPPVAAPPAAAPPPAGQPAAGPPPAGQPAAAPPAAGQPAAAPPAAGQPAAGQPAASQPAAGTPTSGTPTSGTPTSGAPASGTPTAATPGADTPAAGTPAAGTPTAVAARHKGSAVLTTSPREVAKRIVRYGTTRCVYGFRAVVTGLFIRKVVFSVAGRVIATRSKWPYSVYVKPGKGIRTLTARVTYTDGTPAAKLTMRYRACAAQAARNTRDQPRRPQRPPAFTG